METSVLETVIARGKAPVTPEDLADLISVVGEVTQRLQTTHETLRSEVSRLEAELRQARSQLRRARELAALGEMAAGIAHEVRNPLGSIKLFANVLAEDLGDRPEAQATARKIVISVNRLNDVVSDVLAFSRELKVRPENIGTQELVREALTACADLIGPAAVDVNIDRLATSKHSLWCDTGLMRQAVINLLRNAGQALAESTQETRRISIRPISRRIAVAEGQMVAATGIQIVDNGPGIPNDVLDRLFNPFFTTRETGTGLGLAIVHRIVDAHQGRISITNNRPSGGRGVTVELLLPCAPTAHPQCGENE